MMTVRIEMGRRNFDVTMQSTEFVVRHDNIGIINYYIEVLDFEGYEYIVYHNGVPVKWQLWGWGSIGGVYNEKR